MKQGFVNKFTIVLMVGMLISSMLWIPGDVASAATAEGDVKPIVMYFQNSTEANYVFDYSTTHVFNTTLGDRRTNEGDTQAVRLNWYLSPELAGSFTVSGDIGVTVFANTSGVSSNANFNLEIYEVLDKSASQTDEVLVATGGPAGYTLTTSIDSYSVVASGVNHTFQEGSSIRIYLEVQGGADSYFTVWYGDATYDSRVVFDSLDYVRVAEIYTLNYANEITTTFDPEATQTVIKIRADISDPFGGYDIQWVRVTVLGPDGAVVLGNATMELIDGTPISYVSTYGRSISYNYLETGTYTIIVYVMDNNGQYYYTHFQNYEYGPYGDEGTGFFSIGFPNRVDFTVVDCFGTPLEDAAVRLVYNSSVVIQGATDGNGNLTVYAFTGTYRLDIEWEGTPVVDDETLMILNDDENNTVVGDLLAISSDLSVRVYANVGSPVLHLLDMEEKDLESASIYLTYPNGTGIIAPFITDMYGTVSLSRVPGGEYEYAVFWKGSQVARDTLTMHFNRSVPTPTYWIACSVYNLNIVVTDSSGETVPGVNVMVYSSGTGIPEDFGTSDDRGIFPVRLPSGEKEIKAYWHGVEVYHKTGIAVYSSESLSLNCSIYTLTVHAIGRNGQEIEGASVTLEKDGRVLDYGTTSTDGVSFRVAPAAYTVNGRLVTTELLKGIDEERTENVTVDGNSALDLNFSTYPPHLLGTPAFQLSILLILMAAGLVVMFLVMRREMGSAKQGGPGQDSQDEDTRMY